MTNKIHPKLIDDRNEYDDLFETAIELQQRARQNHGLTLDIKDCIGISIKMTYANAVCEIAEGVDALLIMAQHQ